MLNPIVGAGFIVKGLALMFIGLFDRVAYWLVSVSYTLFLAVSRINIFGTDAGAEIYNGFAERIYMVLSIVMVFFFAYQLLMLIIDPDGGDKLKRPVSMIKDTLISVIAIVLCPLIFEYMSVFQEHVLMDNTIPSIILGGTGSADMDSSGRSISLIVFMAFFHPEGTSYSTFIESTENGGAIKADAQSECVKTADADVCEAYINAYTEWLDDDGAITAFTSKASLRNVVNDDRGMEYMWILSTGAAIMVAYFFISYTIDLGTRAVKLAFLQVVAPIPLIMRIFPQTKGTFDKWRGEILRTYADVFIRIAVISFTVYLCTLIPTLLDAVFSSI